MQFTLLQQKVMFGNITLKSDGLLFFIKEKSIQEKEEHTECAIKENQARFRKGLLAG